LKEYSEIDEEGKKKKRSTWGKGGNELVKISTQRMMYGS